MSAALLPPIPRPPHDPTSLRLNGSAGSQAGWLALPNGLQSVQFGGPQGALMLAQQPGLERSLGEPGGSFGGLRPPWNVAIAPGGSIYLLDRSALALKIFDPCACVFLKTPCFGGQGSARRQLDRPGGIGICAGNLFVCDSGNHRLGVFALHGYVLRDYWSPPKTANLAQPWQPTAVAFDALGRVYVSDPANGAVHRFHPNGTWLGMIAGLGAVSYLAVDCTDRLLAVIGAGAAAEVRVVHLDGRTELLDPQVNAAAGLFAPMPFAVDRDGRLHLGGLCASENPPEPGCQTDLCTPEDEPARTAEVGVFTPDGDPWQPPDSALVTSLPPFLGSGRYISQALDSHFYRCQWHRVVLEGETPPGAYVVVSTFTAEAPLPDSEILALPEQAWVTRQAARLTADSLWDCLVLSGPGRYLWLRLELRSSGMTTPQVRSVEIEFPRISLRRFLPAVFGEEPVSADFTDRFLAIFDTTLRSIEGKLDRLAAYFDPLSAPLGDGSPAQDFLDWLAGWVGISLERGWPEERKRRFLKQVGQIFPLRGTREGLRRQLLLYFDISAEACCCPDDQPVERCDPLPLNCRVPEKKPCAWQPPEMILEHYQLRRWLFLGAGKLGDQAALWGASIVNRTRLDGNAQAGVTQLKMTPDPQRDPFMVYAHRYTVFAPGCFGKDEANRRALESMLRRESPAHTSFDVRYVEPRFRIGVQSTIGLDAVIGRIPQGVTLQGEQSLGQDTVLTAGVGPGGPSLRIGSTSQIGGSTRLD